MRICVVLLNVLLVALPHNVLLNLLLLREVALAMGELPVPPLLMILIIASAASNTAHPGQEEQD